MKHIWLINNRTGTINYMNYRTNWYCFKMKLISKLFPKVDVLVSKFKYVIEKDSQTNEETKK